MTRPSEAEVRNLLERAADDIMCPNCASAKNYCDDCQSLKVELRATAAALSTPPLPSAEPVAWKVEESLDGRVYNTFWFGDDPERAERIRARMDSLGVKMTPLYTTPPAAAGGE